jgi:protein-ribulosamine 3-kinase
MFEAESDGLRELRSANALRVPEVLDCGIRNGEAFIALERFIFDRADAATEALLGERLALLHRHTEDQFGWFRDNTIGLTPQVNTRCDDWVDFFRRYRLEFQLELAKSNGYGADLDQTGAALCERLPDFFSAYEPQASLLHGDLWGGNQGADNAGNPVIYDPACYYGDHETDLAMMELFGGPGERFFSAYREVFPIDDGYPVRRELYNLYHILNHAFLFGGGYEAQARRMVDHLLSQL